MRTEEPNIPAQETIIFMCSSFFSVHLVKKEASVKTGYRKSGTTSVVAAVSDRKTGFNLEGVTILSENMRFDK